MQEVRLRNNVKIIGEGKQTIVFGHGFGCSQKIWQMMLPYFKDQYRIVLFDYVGSGNSDCSAYNRERYSNLHGYAKDIVEVLESINAHQIIFVGHSVSSMIGLLASIVRPELFNNIIMISPSPRYRNDLPDYYGGFDDSDIKELLQIMEKNFVGWASASAAALMNTPDQPTLAKKLEETFHAEDPSIMRDFAEATFLSDHRKDLPKATIPTLIIQCSEDSIVPIEAASYLNQNIANSSLRVIGAKGHYPHLSRPEETSKVILEYLENFQDQINIKG